MSEKHRLSRLPVRYGVFYKRNNICSACHKSESDPIHEPADEAKPTTGYVQEVPQPPKELDLWGDGIQHEQPSFHDQAVKDMSALDMLSLLNKQRIMMYGALTIAKVFACESKLTHYPTPR
jgi:hypothetical protein